MKRAQQVALVTCVATLALIALGAYVRSSGSGLGCSDWPACEGGDVLPTDRKSLIELSHRYLGTIVGLLVIATAVLSWKFYRHVPLVFRGSLANVPLVGLQGLLGAATVVRELPPEIVATHLVTAMLVISLQVTILVGMVLEDPERSFAPASKARAAGRLIGSRSVIALAGLAAVFWIGGFITESGAAVACTDWPGCNGSLLPAQDDQEVMHMLHRYLAAGIVLLLIPVARVAWNSADELAWAPLVAILLIGLYVSQVAIGALNVFLTFPSLLTVAHTTVAATIWIVLVGAAVLGYYEPARERREVPLESSEVPA